MKITLLLAAQATLVISPPPPNAATETMTPTEVASLVCPLQGQLAESIMRHRQSGVPFMDSMRVNSSAEDPYIRQLAVAMVRYVYATPRYRSFEFQARAVDDFRDYVVGKCWDVVVGDTV